MQDEYANDIIRTRPTPLTNHLWQPAHDLSDWVQSVFIGEGPLYNPVYDHLINCSIGWLWTTEKNMRQGRRIVGQCEMPSGGIEPKWRRSRSDYQLWQWFGDVPVFVITIDADFAEYMDDASFCALIEHELHHCGQAEDEFGSPKYRKDGTPVFCKRGHDVEDFIGVRRRYGVGPGDTDLAAFVEAASMPPTVAPARIAAACGTCLR